jgi:hypothetical protein
MQREVVLRRLILDVLLVGPRVLPEERLERVRELESLLDDKREVPLKEFREHYDQAVEQLCATKGYGMKHGEPRRKAQERCRTLISRSATVKQNIHNLLEYFGELCKQSAETGAVSSLYCPSARSFVCATSSSALVRPAALGSSPPS